MSVVNFLIVLGLLLLPGSAVGSELLAEVNGKPITAEEVEKSLGGQLVKLQEQMYNLKQERLTALIDERLLAEEAANRGVSMPVLLDQEVTSRVGLVTEQEVEGFYQQNKARLQGNEATLRQNIRAHLQHQKIASRRAAFVDTLRSKAKVTVYLEPPPIFRAEVPVAGAPFQGPADAAVTIVKFEDFHCPFCKRAQATMARLRSRYADQIKIIHRDFPIDSLHPQARRAHEAARCANAQGKFWEYHDVLYANAPRTSLEELKEYAGRVGLDVKAFEQCLSSGEYRAAVQADVEEGQRVGVTGTPAFFINGRLLSGARPFANFARIVDDELRQTR